MGEQEFEVGESDHPMKIPFFQKKVAPTQTPGAGSDPVQAGASKEFLEACEATRKGWHQTNLLSLSNPVVMRKARYSLRHDDGPNLSKLILEVMGPIAPVKIKDAMGLMTVRHREVAGLICTLAMRCGVADRAPGQAVDLDAVKKMFTNWIDSGDFGVPGVFATQARAIAELMEKTNDTDLSTDRLRLAIVAPLAPALESLMVVSRLGETMLDVLDRTKKNTASIKERAGLNALDDEGSGDPSKSPLIDIAQALSSQSMRRGG